MRFLQNLNTYCRCGRWFFGMKSIHTAKHQPEVIFAHVIKQYISISIPASSYSYISSGWLYSQNITTSSIVPCKPLHTHINPEKKTQKPQYKRHIKPITIHTPQVWLSRRKTSLFWAPRQAGGFGLRFFFEWLFNGYLMAVLWGYHCFFDYKMDDTFWQCVT